MAFVPNAKQLAKLRAAVKAYNAAVRRLDASGRFDVVPNTTSTAQERDRISSARELSTRVRQLRRILTTERSDAQDTVTYKGVTMPKYMKREARNIVRDRNAERREIREKLYPNWEQMSPMQRATAQSSRDIHELHEEDYTDAESFDSLIDEEYPNLPKKAEAYISVWEANGENPAIPALIREMATCEFGFKVLMNSPDIEKEVEYIYMDSHDAEFVSYKKRGNRRASAFKEPYRERISKATQYWYDRYDEYLRREGYFSKC